VKPVYISKKKGISKDKINELAMNSKNKNIRGLYRGINELKRGNQPKNNLVKDENGVLLADSHNILNKKKLHGLSPRANYTDRATAACRRSDCQLYADRGTTWSE
jgi:hypothetical protein